MCLSAGVPVVTLAGKSYVSRLSASLLHAYNLDGLITQTPKQYEKLARSLAHQPKGISNFKLQITNYTSSNFTSSLTQTYLSLAR
jgi:predicted O-linked N-acetylglucosamine transferase (SPINDLY family)